MVAFWRSGIHVPFLLQVVDFSIRIKIKIEGYPFPSVKSVVYLLRLDLLLVSSNRPSLV